MLYIGVRTNFIFEDRIVTQDFSKLKLPDRNNIISSVSYFLQPSLYLLTTTQQRFFSNADELISIAHILTPMQKTPRYSKSSLAWAQYPSTFTFGTQGKLNSLPFPACVIFFLVRTICDSHLRDTTDLRSPIRYPAVGIIPRVSRFRNVVRKTLLKMDYEVIACLMCFVLTNFKYIFLNVQHACLRTLTLSMQ